jgi:hypothetical protein
MKKRVWVISIAATLILSGCSSLGFGAAEPENQIGHDDWPGLLSSCDGLGSDGSYYEIQKEGTEIFVTARGLNLRGHTLVDCIGGAVSVGAPTENLGDYIQESARQEGQWEGEKLGVQRVEYGTLSVYTNRTSESTYVLRITIGE